jgi:hypothetical protein
MNQYCFLALRFALLSPLAAGAGACSTQNISETLTQTAALGEPTRVSGTPLTVYGMIASGATNCWFAPTGQLKKSHVFHAEAESPVKGETAEIAVHERDVASGQTWGARVFKISLKPIGEQTEISVENLKLPPQIAGPMRADAFDWAQGGKGCRLKPAETPAPAPASAKKPAKTKTPKSE